MSENTNANDKPMIDPDVVALMRCPLTRSPLRLENGELVSEVGGLRYPIDNGIPVLLIDEAKMPEGVSNLAEFKEKYKDQIPA